MRAITKRYGDLVALDGVDLEVQEGESHALVGENGAGKSTLMRVLCGLTCQTAGEVLVRGEPIRPGDAREALSRGIAIVQQHFALVPSFTVAENVVLGEEPRRGPFLHGRRMQQEVEDLTSRLGMSLRPGDRAGDLPVGQQQAVEILKALHRKARCLVLDEPTASLSPAEGRRLFQIVGRLREEGVTVLLVTHRVGEVMAHADRASVLRRGRIAGRFEVRRVDQGALVKAIIGEGAVPEVLGERRAEGGEELLAVRDIALADHRGASLLDGVSFALRRGQIVGVAGVAGNGQTELGRALTGRLTVTSGRIILMGRDVTGLTASEFRRQGVASIPEDRESEGLVPGLSVAENAILGNHRSAVFRRGWLFNRQAIRAHARAVVEGFDVQVKDLGSDVKALSGGNRQKLVVGREMSNRSCLIVASQPTRGLDIRATAFARGQLIAARDRGSGVLLISQDLEEIIQLSDRVLVMRKGRIAADLNRGEADEERLGLLMTGA